jgi:hypothetical protein
MGLRDYEGVNPVNHVHCFAAAGFRNPLLCNGNLKVIQSQKVD